jgi:chromate reductase
MGVERSDGKDPGKNRVHPQMPESTRTLRVLGISGSLRRRSYNTAALHVAAAEMPEDMTLEIAEIGDLPLYNPDDERAHGFPEPVQRLRRQVAAADALLVATTEYNYSVTGALKNAIDWLSRPPEPPVTLKPTAILGAGGRLGTARAQHHFRDIARHNDLRLVQKPEVFISEPWQKFDDDLELTDERTRGQIRRLVLALRSLILRMEATHHRVMVYVEDARLMGNAVTLVREVGYVPVAVDEEETAMEMIDPGQFSAVVFLEEIEPGSRAAVVEHTRQIAPSTRIVDVSDPASIAGVLEASIRTSS